MTLNELPIVNTGKAQPVQVNLITGDGLELDQAVEITADKKIHLSLGHRTRPVSGHELACGGSTPFKPMSWFAAGSFTKWVNSVKPSDGYAVCQACISKREQLCHI
jgi:hypothetical protein